MEDIAKATPGPKLFRMHMNVDEGISRELLQRVRPAGFQAVILYIDAIGPGSSDARIASGRALPYGNFPNGSLKAGSAAIQVSNHGGRAPTPWPLAGL